MLKYKDMLYVMYTFHNTKLPNEAVLIDGFPSRFGHPGMHFNSYDRCVDKFSDGVLIGDS